MVVATIITHSGKGTCFQEGETAQWKVRRTDFQVKVCISKAVGKNKSHFDVRLRKGSSSGRFI